MVEANPIATTKVHAKENSATVSAEVVQFRQTCQEKRDKKLAHKNKDKGEQDPSKCPFVME